MDLPKLYQNRILKTTLLFFSTFLICFICTASDKQKDSLLYVMKYGEPQLKIKAAKDFGHQFYKTIPNEVLSNIDQVMSQNNSSSLDSVEFCFIKSLGSYYANDFKGHNTNLKVASSILDQYEGEKSEYYYYLKYHKERIKSFHILHTGTHSQALETHLNAVEYAEKSKDLKSIFKSHLSMGGFYVNFKDYKNAISHLTKCNAIDITGDFEANTLKYNTYSELASSYLALNNLDSTSHYLEMIPEDHYTFPIIITKMNYYSAKGNKFKAIALADSILIGSSKPKKSPKHWLPFIRMLKANNLFDIKKYAEAEQSWLNSRLEFLKLNDKENLGYISNRLYEYYKDRGKFEKALIFHEEFKEINDNALFENQSTVLKGIKDSKALDDEIQITQELKAKDKLSSQIIQRQKLINNFGFLITGLLSLFGFFYYRSAQARKVLNQELKATNEELASKNIEIKSKADELSFISQNFPEAIGRLDANFGIKFQNKQFENIIGYTNLLEISESEQKDVLEKLSNNDQASFSWDLADKHQTHQVKILKLGSIASEGYGYLFVMQNITELKEKQRLRIQEVEASINDLQENVYLNGLEKKQLTTSLEIKNKEIVSRMMQITEQNSEIEAILENLRSVYRESNSTIKLKLSKIIGRLNNTLDIEDAWLTFNTYFKEIHPSFLCELNKVGSELTDNEVRYCTFIKLGLRNKEVADMLNVSTKTVEVTRYRIKKKLSLTKEINLNDYIRAL